VRTFDVFTQKGVASLGTLEQKPSNRSCIHKQSGALSEKISLMFSNQKGVASLGTLEQKPEPVLLNNLA
jgi:hypothetical protein